VTSKSKSRIEALVRSGRDEGANVALDGTKRIHNRGKGNWLYPTVLSSVKPHMEVYTQEIFGPVLVCLETESYKEALDIVNSNPNGNGAAIFTQNAATAKHFESEVAAGQVGINVPIPLGPPQLGFTGSRGSMLGDLPFYGLSGVHFFTKPKNVVSRWSTPDLSSASSTVIPTSR